MLAGFAPVYTARARLLILGSFPGVASLAKQQYYAHPQNQFWRLLGTLIERDLSARSYEERLEQMNDAGVALWDVVQTCERQGSLDSAIRGQTANPLSTLIDALPRLQAVAFNGKTAAREAKYLQAHRGLTLYELPSSSPAYASLSFAQKLTAWQVLRPHIGIQ